MLSESKRLMRRVGSVDIQPLEPRQLFAATVTIPVAADATVRNGTYSTTNLGSTTSLSAKQDGTSYDRQAFIKFDISALDKSVTHAVLRVYSRFMTTGAATTPVTVSAVSNTTWSESTINWSNKPAVGSAVATKSIGTAWQWYEFDISSYIAAQAAAGAKSVSFNISADKSNVAEVLVNSRESGGTKPELVVTTGDQTTPPPTTDPDPDPTPTDPQPAPSPTGYALLTQTATPSMSLKLSAGTIKLTNGKTATIKAQTLNFDAPQILSSTYTGVAPPNWDLSLPFDHRWQDASANLVPPTDTLVLGGMFHSIVPGSVTVKVNGVTKTNGTDYKLNMVWGQVLNSNNRLGTPGTGKISITYKAILQRLDLVELMPDGTVKVKKGASAVNCPILPAPDAGAVGLAGIHINTLDGARSSGFYIKTRDVNVMKNVAPVAPLNTDTIPKTLAKLRAKKPVNIAFFGDSITAGCEATNWLHDDSRTYTGLVTQGLHDRFGGTVTKTMASQGGISATQAGWVFDKYVIAPNAAGKKVDLVIIAMGMNDYGKPSLDPYKNALRGYVAKARAAGIEVMIIPPFQSNPYAESLYPDRVSRLVIAQAAKSVAIEKDVAYADVSTAWNNMTYKGYAPVSQIHNFYNHPGNYGHKIYADTIMAAFPK